MNGTNLNRIRNDHTVDISRVFFIRKNGRCAAAAAAVHPSGSHLFFPNKSETAIKISSFANPSPPIHLGSPKFPQETNPRSVLLEMSSQPQFRYTQTPSKVLHLRNLPWECAEEELVELCKPFGRIVNTMCNVGANRNQAFVEFVSFFFIPEI